MDPITALGIAGNVVQFIDFGLKVVSKAHEIHASSTGGLVENVDLRILTEDIAAVTAKLSVATGAGLDSCNGNLDDICKRCSEAANELLGALERMYASGEKSKWRSVRQALKAMWGKAKVEELRRKLEMWRDEIQFHVLVDLRSKLNVESAKQCGRFDSLDNHAKAILEALSTNQNLIHDVIQFESAKSVGMHQRAALTILRKQEETHVEVKEALDSLDKQATAALQGLSDNQESIQEVTVAILSNQDESLAIVEQALESMDENSRVEHEATRRELAQMKQVVVQIQHDMVRRDNELKTLLLQLSKTHSEKERKKLQEKSNAVTVALCALVTIYQGLQKMILGIQAQAKFILTSANLRQLWDENSSDPSSKPERVVQLTILDALINKPPNCIPSHEMKVDYIFNFDLRYGLFSSRLIRTWDSVWTGLGIVDYNAIGKNSGLNPEQWDLTKEEVCILLELLGPSIESFAECKNLDGLDPVLISRQSETLALVKSVILISTILVQCLSPVGAAKVIDAIDCEIRASPASAGFANPPNGPLSRSSADPGREQDARPAILFRRLLRHITAWSTVGKIAGVQRIAELHLRSRIARWDAAKGSMLAATIIGPQNFFKWFILKPEEPAYLFDIGSTEAGRARGAVIYAIIEFLITFGFRLTTPTIELGNSGLYARVERATLTGTTVLKNPTSMEEIATRLFKHNFLNQ